MHLVSVETLLWRRLLYSNESFCALLACLLDNRLGQEDYCDHTRDHSAPNDVLYPSDRRFTIEFFCAVRLGGQEQGQRHRNQADAERGWKRMLDWFKRYGVAGPPKSTT